MGTFGTVINCMDGRVQKCINDYVMEKYSVDYVDTITMAGPCKILAAGEPGRLVENLKFRLDISANKHHSRILIISGHADCAAVEDSDEQQKAYILSAVEIVKTWGFDMNVIALWVDQTWTAHEI